MPAISREEYLRRWSALHGDLDPRANRLVYLWLSLVHVVARPLVAVGASPNAVTTAGLAVVGAAVAIVGAAGGEGAWLILAGVLVLASGLVDGLDGAVAVMSEKVTKWGYVYDSVVDRIAEMLFLSALWLAGAPAWLCVLVGGLTVVQEYARARAGAAGMSEVGVVSVWERPSRVLVVGLFLVGAGTWPARAEEVVTLGAAVALGLAIVGLTQVLIILRRRLREV